MHKASVASLVLIVTLSSASQSQTSCERDADCQNDQICENDVCVHDGKPFAATKQLAAVKASSNTSFLVLEDELLTRFKRRFKGAATSITLTSASVVTSDVKVTNKISSLPSSITEEVYAIENSTDQERTKSVSLTINTIEGEKFTFEKAITTHNESAFNGGFNIEGVSADGSMKNTWTIGTKEGREVTRNRSRTYKEDFEQKVGPHKTLIIKVKREVFNSVYALQGGVTFDGKVNVKNRWKDVYACGPFGTGRCSRMKESNASYWLSQYLSEDERTLPVEGKVVISSSENTRTTTSYVVIDTNKLYKDIGPEQKVALTAALPSNIQYNVISSDTKDNRAAALPSEMQYMPESVPPNLEFVFHTPPK